MHFNEYSDAPMPPGPQRGRRQEPELSADRRWAFGQAVQARREELGWSRQRLCDVIGWNVTAVRRLEQGERAASVTSAFRIADALDRPLPFLLIDAEAILADKREAA